MKKIISLIIAGLMTMSLCANSVLAAETSSIEISNFDHDITTDSVVFEAVVTSKRGNVPLTLVVTDANDNVVYAESQTTSSITATNNVSKAEFNRFRFLEDSMPTGQEYLFTVYAEHLDISAEKRVTYNTMEMWFNFLTMINSFKAQYNRVADLTTYLAGNVQHIDEAFTQLTSNGAKDIVSRYLMNDEYELPASWQANPSETDKTTLANAVRDFKAAYNSGVAFAQLYDCYRAGDMTLTKDLFDNWYSANKAKYNLEADNASTTTLNEADFMKQGGVFAETYNAESFYKRLTYVATELAKSGASVMQKEIVNAILLTKVEGITNGLQLGTFISPYVSYIRIDYRNADNTAKGIAHGAVAGKYYATLSDFRLAVENSIPAGTQGDSGNSGSTSIGAGGGIGTGIVNNGQGTAVLDGRAPFKDIENYGWAKEAIDFLYRRSIIAGRDENTFDPAGAVTRAEFIKMLVATYNFAANDYQDYKFNDITGGEWYAIYVKKAAAMGVVTGDQNGNFNPNAQITREDMAVTIYRASKFAEATAAPVFGDAADISDYAKAAVATLHENGIVSGMGNMMFAPKKNVTRAEAAQILYNVLIRTIK